MGKNNKKRKLWVISNRLPDLNNGTSAGGLVVALSPLLNGGSKDHPFDEITLCGYDADERTEAPDNTLQYEEISGLNSINRALVTQTNKEYEAGYNGYLPVKWALAHGLVDKIDHKALKHYPANRRRIDRFADVIADHIGPKDIIWVQDYHFEELGDALRARGVECRIGHFSHIPKERVSDFNRLPKKIQSTLQAHENNVVRAMLAYDLIGVQRQRDLTSLGEHIGFFGEMPERYETISANLSGRDCKLGYFPASIDVTNDVRTANEPLTKDERKLIDRGQKIPANALRVIWAGRADISKNIPMAYDVVGEVLKDKKFVEKIRIQQGITGKKIPIHAYGIAPPTREGMFGYGEEMQAIRDAHNRLLSKYSGLDVATLNEDGLQRDILLKAYREGIGMFLSHRDGQLLGVFEHQAAQELDNPYPVIVSNEAGAADLMPGAIKVDPHNKDEIANALKQAMTMSPTERKSRHSANMRMLRQYTSNHQTATFVSKLVA